MKIVDLKTFLQLPDNTVYSPYDPCVFDGISIKGPNCGEIDFFCTDVSPPPVDASNTEELMFTLECALTKGTRINLDFNSGGRDGCFVEDQLYAVWDDEDVKKLIRRLEECINKDDKETL